MAGGGRRWDREARRVKKIRTGQWKSGSKKQEAAQQVRREATFNNAGGLPPVDDLLVGCVGRLTRTSSLIIASHHVHVIEKAWAGGKSLFAHGKRMPMAATCTGTCALAYTYMCRSTRTS